MRLQAHRSALRRMTYGVVQKVDQHTRDLPTVGTDSGQSFWNGAHQMNTLRLRLRDDRLRARVNSFLASIHSLLGNVDEALEAGNREALRAAPSAAASASATILPSTTISTFCPLRAAYAVR